MSLALVKSGDKKTTHLITSRSDTGKVRTLILPILLGSEFETKFCLDGYISVRLRPKSNPLCE